METVVCTHKETLASELDGIELGTCRICDQETQYNTRDPKANPTLLKLGRIDGKVVLPNPALSLSLLSEADRLDLKEARKFIPKATEEPAAGVPPRPKKRKQIWAYYEKNKEAIIADYYALERIEFFKRWGLSASTWLKLYKDWGVTLKGRGPRKTMPRLAPKKERRKIKEGIDLAAPEGLPPFPPFNDDWAPAVQIEWLHEWLHTYKELKLAGVKGL